MTGLPLVVTLQVHGGRDGQVRDAPAGAVARVHGAAAEAEVHQGAGAEADHGERGGRAATCEALRRTGSPPPLHEPPHQSLQGG